MANNIQVAIRVDASVEIGMGHLMRCLALADLLRKNQAKVFFICRKFSEKCCDLVIKKGYPVFYLPYIEKKITAEADAEDTTSILKTQNNINIDYLIVDHYALDQRWESEMRLYTENIMVIDDLANRHHDCDILLDQNYYKDVQDRYAGLIPRNCRKFIGPKFALLREEFFKVRENLPPRDGIIKNIIVFFGGSDPTNETAKSLRALQQLNRPDITINVVIGALNLNKTQLQQIGTSIPGINFYYQTKNIAQLMAQASLSIGAGGIATWERCYLGLPSLVITIVPNQAEVAKNVADAGAIWHLGYYDGVTITDIAEAVKTAIDNPDMVKKISNSAVALMKDVSMNQDLLIKTILNAGQIKKN